LNKLHESDAELINLPEACFTLALTTDTIAEEIESGLYGDPYTAGRMLVIVNLSDLSAVGANPIGLLLSEIFAADTDKNFISELQRGISDACIEAGTYILGGDTNTGAKTQIGATATGIISDGKIITRKGCLHGDILFSSGKLGAGNAFAFSALLAGKEKSVFPFIPVIRTKEGIIIRKHGSCCMDTSDGAVAALDQLMRINGKGFVINAEYKDYIDANVIGLSHKFNIPVFNFLAGIHGEFELIFTVPNENAEAFLSDAGRIGWIPVQLGNVIAEQEIIFKTNDGFIKPDTGYIRNLYEGKKGNVKEYAEELIRYSMEIEQKTGK
ncbi:MAG: AIR synthase related protein, partial [Ignavibacteria bacterium]|nr:AIR synthase related protein [Ignavibacteria bacterium]